MEEENENENMISANDGGESGSDSYSDNESMNGEEKENKEVLKITQQMQQVQ